MDSLQRFREFDFENHAGWRSYRAKLEIPAGTQVDQTLQKLKARWYQREIDPDFDPASVQGSQAPSAEKGPGSQPESQAAAGSKDTGSNSTHSRLRKLKPRPQEALFVMHLALILLAVLHLQPLSRRWSQRAWLYFLQTSALSSFYRVYLKHGLPKLRPFPAALKQWAQPVTTSHDFQYTMLSLLFIGSKPIALVLMPPTVLALYHVSAYLSQVDSIRTSWPWRKYGARMHAWMAANQRQALLYNACAEIGTAFVSVLALLSPPRNFLVPFFVFNFLRMRYWSPESASYHRQAWSMVNQRAGFILQYVPILQRPVDWVQNWFLSAPGQS
ncbi:hypothetical protein WJX73_003583 [Symbiochloris irregularis]|uniref:Glycerophosphocholine acyltransferase 1 n=1 Tax=Symbiochloris irregularis TaxID=706552 RepID=A0AAW1PIS7_9CHLO